MIMGQRIIIVDDDRETREMLQVLLEMEGFEVKLAANGLRLISTLHVDKPDAILLDVMMSWIDGFELCEPIKNNEESPTIPVFFIWARPPAADTQRGTGVAASDYFTKPLDTDRLVPRLHELAPQSPSSPTPHAPGR